MRATARGTVIAAVVVACALPSAAANVFPRAAGIWNGTAATSGDVAMMVLLIMTALIMAAGPFAIKMARNLLEKLAYIVILIGLATFNWAMAHDTIGKLRDGTAAPVRQLQADSAALKSRIKGASTAAAQVPQHPWTTTEMVIVAQEAVTAAEVARAQECGKVGDNCRLRVGEKAVAVAELGKMQAHRALTARLEAIEIERKVAQTDLDKLGYVPESADKSASRLAKDLSHWVDLGADPDETLIDWLIKVTAAVVEVVGLVGPRMIVLAIFGDIERKPRSWLLLLLSWRRRHVRAYASKKSESADTTYPVPMAEPAAAPRDVAVPKGAATAAELKKLSRNKPAAVSNAESVRQWFKVRTIPRAGSKLKPKEEVYLGSYVPWCGENDITPVSFTVFGGAIKKSVADGGCGVELERTRSKRDSYLGIALVTGPKLAVSNA